jgi:hypothetical protein
VLATTTSELAVLFRQDVDDVLSDDDTDDSDRLWSDVEVYRYMTAACDALAKLTDGIYKVLELPIVSGESVISLPRTVLQIREAKLVSNDVPVVQRNANERRWDTYSRDDYGSCVRGPTYTRDYERRAIVLYPEPTADDTLEVQCTVTTATALSENMLLPFLDMEDQQLLLLSMKAQAYKKQDVETQDLQRAKMYEQDFKAGALQRKYELQRYRRTPGTVRPQE